MAEKDPWLLDAHCDSLYIRAFFGDSIDLDSGEVHINNPSIMEALAPDMKEGASGFNYQVSMPLLRRGNIGCLFLNVGDMDLLLSSVLIDGLGRIAAARTEELAICRCAAEVRDTVDSGKVAIVMSVEGQFMFLGQIDLLRNWHSLGVRVASLSHGEGAERLSSYAEMALGLNKKIRLAKASSYALQGTASRDALMEPGEREKLYKEEKGLTGFGKEALLEMGELGMVCDLSHANDATFWEALELSNGKLCATHSNCFALLGHTRNLTNGMMRALAEHGGVMGLCFFGDFIDEREPSLTRFVDHVVHALEIMGEDNVGIGTDYDGVPFDAFMAVPNPEHTGELWGALENAGLDASTIEKVAHENFLRLLE